MARLFGTDGVRGLANVDLTPELGLAIASAAAAVLTDGTTRPRVVVGRDPRASGEMLENAVVAGLTAAGADAIRVGVLPTPAVAFLTDRLGADFGIMLSASHNAMPDNGIKIFAAGGHKLDDAVEDAIEAQLTLPMPRPTGSGIGRVLDHHIGGGEYVEHLLASLGGADARPLAGLKVVVDCANGAASSVAATATATRDGCGVRAAGLAAAYRPSELSSSAAQCLWRPCGACNAACTSNSATRARAWRSR